MLTIYRKDSFLSEMSLEQFNMTMHPRVLGTLNLDSVLKDKPLDFFMMWSSWTTLVGSASQGNYMASNAFMDAFARHKRALGQPTVSLALSQILDVGIVSDIPEYQMNLLQMGLYGNNEAEFLEFCETAILTSTEKSPDNDGFLLAGVEPSGLLEKDKAYPVGDMTWTRDARFSRLVQAVKLLGSGENESTATQGGGDDDDESEPLVSRIHQRIARLLYVPVDDIETKRPINSYGIDSMVAAQLRNWLFGKFNANISLLSLLSPAMSIEKLADEVTAAVQT